MSRFLCWFFAKQSFSDQITEYSVANYGEFTSVLFTQLLFQQKTITSERISHGSIHVLKETALALFMILIFRQYAKSSEDVSTVFGKQKSREPFLAIL